jgi:hypothetical protein
LCDAFGSYVWLVFNTQKKTEHIYTEEEEEEEEDKE